MAEQGSDREDREEREDREGRERAEARQGGAGRPGGDGGEQPVPFDEEAAWAAIVAGYGEEPPDPPGAKPFKSVEDLALLETGTNDGEGGEAPRNEPPRKDPPKKETPKPLGSSVSFAPGVGTGPRDYTVSEPAEEDFDDGDEGHFVPPEPPPLPAADATAKFAWLAVIGGPVLLLLAVLLGWDMTWWLTTLGIGGFVGGFATLVMRMRTDDEEDDDPGRGAVV
ncbi:hypothetical protein [Streptomyces glaucescens]|uniref:Uncharacterized protein n=1 Tax=Streptomyces glaucescens TaxID=1907 RepID=A0A089X7X2_STRGA|nr:hypothetical protein [Streptomyces glaucescens]AIR97946.1 hypothetical protein SGLAU_09680 [Streptomyces glaucescens]